MRDDLVEAVARKLCELNDERKPDDPGLWKFDCTRQKVWQVYANDARAIIPIVMEDAAKQEREAVVAWLRAHECVLFVPEGVQEPYDEAADAIERGDHAQSIRSLVYEVGG